MLLLGCALSDGTPFFLPRSDSGLKSWTIVHGFDQFSFHTHNGSLEGAAELKFAPLPFAVAFFFSRVKFFIFWPKTMDYKKLIIVHGFDASTLISPHYVEGADSV